MPRAPSQIFVSRHGARLDAADSNWRYTTPTAYDTPLTYGGWSQATNLGSRIGRLIADRLEQIHGPGTVSTSSEASNANGGNAPATTWVRPAAAGSSNNPSTQGPTSNPSVPPITPLSTKSAAGLSSSRIVIHTSPFLRCIQTSIGVAAGISQQLNAALPESLRQASPVPRPLLRLDGWLGEWLCEDYFTDISPPPASSAMIVSAKVDLMRPSSAAGLNRLDTAGGGYKPPVLSYAVAKEDAIPRGHVSHAKEYLDVDYVWDSSKFGGGGDYGEEWAAMHKRVKRGFAMTLEEYTKSGAPPPPGVGKIAAKAAADSGSSVGAANGGNIHSNGGTTSQEGDTILIFVSHGAGCNAMIGALTNQPALMDIGLASLTMAVRRDKTGENEVVDDGSSFADAAAPSFSYPTDVGRPSSSDSSSSSSSSSSKIAKTYEVKITGSTSHLRSTHHRQQSSQFTIDNHLTPPGSDMSRSPSISPAPSPSYRPTTRKNTLTSFNYVKPIPLPSPVIPVTTSPTITTTISNPYPSGGPSIGAAFSGVRRAVSSSSPSAPPSKGLWKPIGAIDTSEEAVADDDELDDKLKILNFGGPVSGTSGTSSPSESGGEGKAPFKQTGLWGGGGQPREPRGRRWTVDSNS